MDTTFISRMKKRILCGTSCRNATKRVSAFILCVLFLSACVLSSYPKVSYADTENMEFIRRSGDKLIMGESGQPIWLRGICFDNFTWWKKSDQDSQTPYRYVTEADYQKVKDMNMNCVRFFLNYLTFEDDSNPYAYKQSGWDWLDKNIEWARKYGIYLILDMHVPQGSYDSGSTKWVITGNTTNQNRLKALWKAIAERYADEPVIAGYDLFNEPTASSSFSQWQSLANEITGAIRTVDTNHLIIAERLIGVSGDGKTWGQDNYPLVNDTNTMYSFHFYTPIEYSHQNYQGGNFGDGGKYPDESVMQFPDDTDLIWYKAAPATSPLPAGDSDWTFYQSPKYTVDDHDIIVGKPIFVSYANQGTAFFDDFVIKEYDESGNWVRDIFSTNITTDSGWSFWSAKGSDSGKGALSTTTGHNDNISLSISGTQGDSNFTGNSFEFEAKYGHSYSISGWVKGTGINSGASCDMRLDFMKSYTGRKVYPRNKDFLADEFSRLVKFGKDNNVPMYLGEFGIYDWSDPSDGQIDWMKDVIELAKSNNLQLTCFDYRGEGFGIYPYQNGLPVNQSLIDLLTDEFYEGTQAASQLLQFSCASYSIPQTGEKAAITVSRTGGSDTSASVDYSTSDGTANAGTNYKASSGTLTFNKGETTKTFDVDIINDFKSDGDKTVNLALSNPTGSAQLATGSTAVLTITQDDSLTPYILFSSAGCNAYEGSTVGVTVTRAGDAGGSASVDWSVSGGTSVPGTDFTGNTKGTLEFAEGEKSKAIEIPVVNDNIKNSGKTIELSLANASGSAIIGTQSTTAVNISDYIPDTKTSTNTVKTLTVQNSKIQLKPGTSTLGLLTAELANGASYSIAPSGAAWKSSDSRIATVSNGVIKAVDFGSATITATYGKKSATFAVSTALKGLTCSDSSGTALSGTASAAMHLNSTKALSLKATFADGSIQDVASSAVWKTSSADIAAVSSGVITTGGKPGACTVTGTYGKKSVTFQVDTRVKDLSVPINKKDLKLKPGDVTTTIRLTATSADSFTSNVTDAAVWKTSNSKIATIANGVITTSSTPGTANITATFGGKTATIKVDTNLRSLTPSTTSLKMPLSATSSVKLAVIYSNSTTTYITSSAVWKTSNAKVAKVVNGVISTTDTPGTANITAAYGGKTATVKVDTTLKNLVPSETTVKMKPGGTSNVQLTVTYSDGSTADVTSGAVWKVSNTRIAAVDKGAITATATPGTTSITASFGGKTASIKVDTTLKNLVPSATALKISPGETSAVQLTATYSDGSTADVTADAAWSTSNARVATVSNGTVTAAGKGSTTIKALYCGKTVSITINVS